jgi:localization factor PodJL
MRANLPTGPKSSESEIRQAVETAARRAGLSPADWLARVEAEARRLGPSHRPPPGELDALIDDIVRANARPAAADDRVPAAAKRSDAAQTVQALDSAAEWIERSKERLNPSLDFESSLAESLSRTLVSVKERLDLVDRRTPDPASPTALVDTLATLREEIATLGRRLQEPSRWLPALEAVERELETLRVTLGGVATRAELAALDERIGGLVESFGSSAGAARMAALTGRVGSLQSQLQRIATEISEGLHRRIGPELDALSAKIEQVAQAGGCRDAVEALGRQVGELRRAFAQGAGQERVERIAAEVASLGRRMADMQAQQVGASDLAALGTLLEDLQASVLRSERDAATAAIPERLEAVSHRLDNLADRPEWAGLAQMNERVADMAASLETVVVGGARSAEAVAARVDRRLADFAEHFDALARVGATSAQSLADQLHEESTRITGPMRSLSERLADLDRRLETLPSELNRPAKLASDRMGKLAGRLEALASAAEPLAAIGERMDQRLAGLHDRIEALSVVTAGRTERQPAPPDENLAALKAELVALLAQGAKPVQNVAEGLERLSGEIGTLSDRFESGPRPVVERLDRLEESLRELGEHADTLPLELMIRALQERFDRFAPGSPPLDGIEVRLTDAVQRLNLTAAEPVQQALTETLTHLRGLRGEAAIIAERAAKAALRDMPVASAADLDAVRQGFVELKALHASAEKKTQATLKAVHNALETLVMRMPAGLSIAPPASAPQPDSPAVRLEAAVRKLHAAAMAHTEDATAPPPNGEADEVLLDPALSRTALVPSGASFTAPQEGDPGTVRTSFIAAARRAAQAAIAEAESSPKDEAAGTEKAAISNPTLIDRIRQTLDGHRRPLLFGAALLMAAGSVPVTGFLRRPSEATVPQPEIGATTVSSIAASGPASPKTEVTGSLLAPPATEVDLPAAAASEGDAAAALPAALGSIELPASVSDPLRRAALAGEPAALYEVASRLEEARGVPRDLAMAARLFETAAQTGLAPAQFRLGHLHESGVGVPRDPTLARIWYERAAAAGNTQAMHNLGVLHAEGRDGKPDYASAVTWFKQASEHGVRDSQYNLAVLLARGVGARQDLSQSYKWFALAAREGDEDARRKRDEVAARLAPADLSAAKAAVAGFRPRPVNRAANEVAPPAQDWTAAAERSISHRS